MAYNDAIMNSADKQKIAALGEQWKAAQQAGNQGGMNEAHEQAELIRKKYGYSGGGDGSGFKIVGNSTVLPEAKDQSESINKIYDAQQKAKTDALKAAYDQNMADYDAQAAKIPQTYNEARRQVSTQADISRANLNEQLAGSGINVGAGSQLALSQQNSRNAAMGKVSSAEADAMSALEAQRQKVKTAYQNAVAQAISENDAARAKALYTEAQRVDNSIVNTAVKQLSVDTTLAENERSRLEQQAATLAKYGDFSGYAALGYSQDQIDAMQKVWGAQNPKLYYERTGAYPASYTASNRRTGGGGGSGGGGSTQNPVQNSTRASTKDISSIHENSSITNVNGSGWTLVRGYGRVTPSELEALVNAGKVKEVDNGDGTYTYRTVGYGKVS